jgi:hypothetical protein
MAVRVYLSFADADAALLQGLVTHLTPLGRDGRFAVWHRGLVQLGQDAAAEARRQLDQADVAVLLLSPEYLAEDALVNEAERALVAAPRTRVVPVPLRRCDWKNTQFGHLQPVPREDRPLAGWPGGPDDFWDQVVRGLISLDAPRPPPPPPPPQDERGGRPRQVLTVRLLPGGHVEHLHRRSRVHRAAGRIDGRDLFQTLFPAGAWDAVAHHLHGRLVSPPREGLRLRLWIDDPDLLALPFEELAHGRDRLCAPGVGWVVVRCPDGEPHGVEEVSSPGPLCALIPPGPDGDAHLQALTGVLKALSPHHVRDAYLRVVRDPAALPAAIAGMNPQMIHVHGPADLLPTAALKALGRARLLSLCGAGWHRAAAALCRDVALQVLTPTPSRAVQALRALLRGCEDAALALHGLDLGADLAVYTRCERLAVRAQPVSEPHALSHLRVDRKAQRAHAYHQVSALLRSASARVEVLVAYGAPGNLVDQFCWQAADHIETQGVQLRVRGVELPRPGLRTRATIYGDLCQQLCDPGESIEHALRRAADGARLLWLDFGTFQEDALEAQDMEAFMEMCHRDLAPRCPGSPRVVAYLALEMPQDLHESIREQVHELRDRLYTDRCRCEPLPPLDVIELVDLRDFLRDPENSSCPPHLAQDAARLIHAAGKGGYQPCTDLIKEAERTSWYDLIDRLAPRAPTPPENKRGWRR